tara:strand:+ start:14272 stop:15873 length:1602 start_codon:yes stop_codon:yes gene_type:complete
MSTKINARSPYYLSFTAPTESLGTFACTGNKFMANPQNFQVDAYGLITEPVLQNGKITGRSDTKFAENTTSSVISRSVTYTILIPSGYTNSGTGTNTIQCTVTTNQPVKAVATGGSNCPTFSGTIPSLTNQSGTITVNLNDYFSAGGASINNYLLTQGQNNSIRGSISGSTLTITIGSSNCTQNAFVVAAQNAADQCRVASNSFTIAAACTNALACVTDASANETGVDLTGPEIEANGVLHYNSFLTGLVPQEVAFNLNSISPSETYTVLSSPTSPIFPTNSTGSDRNVFVRVKWIIPNGFTNTASSPLVCYYTVVQKATDTRVFTCAMILDKRVLPDGTVAIPTISPSSAATFSHFDSTSAVGYAENKSGSEITRSVTYFVDLASNFTANIGGVAYSAGATDVPCVSSVKQQSFPETVSVGAFTVFLSQGFTSTLAVCNQDGIFFYETNVRVTSSVNSTNPDDHIGAQISQGTLPFQGLNLFYGFSNSEGTVVGSNDNVAFMAKIDNDGIVQRIEQVVCGSATYTGDYPLFT